MYEKLLFIIQLLMHIFFKYLIYCTLFTQISLPYSPKKPFHHSFFLRK